VTSPLLAFGAGVLTIAAPCVLPMLPVVLGSSIGRKERWRPVFIALGFSLAFAAVALLFSTFQHVLGLSHEALRNFASAMLLLFGALMVWPRPFHWLALHMGPLVNRASAWGDGAGQGHWGGFVLGMTLGALWTPCAGPALASVLTLIATEPTGSSTAVLLLAYSIGAGVPMLAIAYGGQWATARVRQLTRHTHRLQQGFGLLVMGVGVATFLQYDSVLAAWLAQFYPTTTIGL
jgi:cytochrome c-type biogenesis protein